MFIDLNPEKIIIDFNPFPKVQVFGPQRYYFVELREYLKNDSESRVLESYEIVSTGDRFNTFKCFIEFYGDFEICVYKFLDGYGLKRIFNHRYSDYFRNVKFNLDSLDENECNIWVERIKKYKFINECFVTVDSKFEYLNNMFDFSPHDHRVDFYKTYNIGRFPKISKDFRSRDERAEGLIWLGQWKQFWSYQHPRSWTNLSSEEIFDDIVGFS